MCTTIQIAIPAETRPEERERWTRGGSVEAIGDAGGTRMLLISSGCCECGTPLGSAAPPTRIPAEELERETARLRRRGWSEHKIARWLESRQSTGAREERLAHERADGASAESVDYWLDLVRRTLESGRLERIGLRVCRGDDTWLDATPTTRIPVAELTPVHLRTMADGALYVFV
jgi:hypothetical protein